MLFIENYNAKSLDRSSVSMIDKFNKRLSDVNSLLENLLLLVDILLSTIRQIRYNIGTAKARIIGNLIQAKEVIDGNGITGTEATIAAIEDALARGDEAISKAETELETIKAAEECNQTPTEVINDKAEECGETPTEQQEEETEPSSCSYCSYDSLVNTDDYPITENCQVCSHEGCNVNISCNEETTVNNPGSCTLSTIEFPNETCNNPSTITIDLECNEKTCDHTSDSPFPTVVDGCTFSCNHSTDCHESAMPHDCSYTCTDGEGCDYGGGDCSYSTTCGQPIEDETCGQTASDLCGEECGETCHMTTTPEEKDDEGDNEGCGDCGDCGNCGEGDGCGDWSEFCGE